MPKNDALSQNNRALRSNPNYLLLETAVDTRLLVGTQRHKITEPYAQIPTNWNEIC